MKSTAQKAAAWFFGAASAIALLGCGSSGEPELPAGAAGAGGGPGQDGGLGGGAAPCLAASPPYGVDPEAGHSLPDLEVTACDSTRVTLDTVRCEATITLFSVAAGWCQPCQQEAVLLEEAAAELEDEGIAIVQILFEDAAALPATSLFCRQWRDQFELTIPVFADPLGRTTELFDETSTPLNVAVDRDGRVLWSATGLVEDVEGELRGLLP